MATRRYPFSSGDPQQERSRRRYQEQASSAWQSSEPNLLDMLLSGARGGQARGGTPSGSAGLEAIGRGALGGDRRSRGTQGIEAIASRANSGPSPSQRGQSYPDAGLDPRRNLAPEGLPSPGEQPGQGGSIADMLRQMQEQQAARQEAIRSQLGSAYDQQINAVRGQGPIMRGLAEEAQGNIGGFFDYAAGAAEAGREPVQSAYETAGQNVEQAYGQATEQVQGLPSVYTDLAEQAGGEGARSGVASRVAAASAPFEASMASGQAATQGNLAQSQAAGEQYLSQLASAAPSEAAMAQSGVEGALQQQLSDIQMQAAQLEGAKQKALMQATADTSGEAFDRFMDLQQLQMAKEKHAMEMQQGGAGGMDLREQLQTEKLMGELSDPTQQQPKRGFDMFLQQQFGDQPDVLRATQTLGNRLTSNWPTEIVQGEEQGVPPEEAVERLMIKLGVAQSAEGLGLETTPIDAQSRQQVRRALEILAGLYQE